MILVLISIAAPQSLPTIGIYPMDAEGVDEVTVSVFASQLEDQLTLSKRFTTVTRSETYKTIEEKILQETCSNESNTLTISTFLLGGDNPSISGTGSLADIEVMVFGSTTLEFVNGAVRFRNASNDSIPVNETVGGWIDIQ